MKNINKISRETFGSSIQGSFINTIENAVVFVIVFLVFLNTNNQDLQKHTRLILIIFLALGFGAVFNSRGFLGFGYRIFPPSKEAIDQYKKDTREYLNEEIELIEDMIEVNREDDPEGVESMLRELTKLKEELSQYS